MTDIIRYHEVGRFVQCGFVWIGKAVIKALSIEVQSICKQLSGTTQGSIHIQMTTIFVSLTNGHDFPHLKEWLLGPVALKASV